MSEHHALARRLGCAAIRVVLVPDAAVSKQIAPHGARHATRGTLRWKWME